MELDIWKDSDSPLHLLCPCFRTGWDGNGMGLGLGKLERSGAYGLVLSWLFRSISRHLLMI
jgi:hypothetical protein